MYQVTKRDGEITEFNLTKISEAIRKAFEAREKEYNQDIIDLLALKVTADFEPKKKEHKIAVEDIQDSVESDQSGICRCCEGIYPVPQAERKNPKSEFYTFGLQRDRGQLCEGDRLAR